MSLFIAPPAFPLEARFAAAPILAAVTPTAGGLISYAVNGQQRLAVTHGMKSAIWPTPKSTAQIVIFGLH